MSEDIMERLRSEAVNWSATCGDLFDEAADELDRRRQDADSMRFALAECRRQLQGKFVEIATILNDHDARVAELLASNNALLERTRKAERDKEMTQELLGGSLYSSRMKLQRERDAARALAAKLAEALRNLSTAIDHARAAECISGWDFALTLPTARAALAEYDARTCESPRNGGTLAPGDGDLPAKDLRK